MNGRRTGLPVAEIQVIVVVQDAAVIPGKASAQVEMGEGAVCFRGFQPIDAGGVDVRDPPERPLPRLKTPLVVEVMRKPSISKLTAGSDIERLNPTS